ncbi:glutamyl-tRNA amidotransferase subunit A [Dactylonectria macrodidyma]|uniref:Glutamyl-tRNA amidotransferase subunit A n=1 Tax=Dactylonectria macrodidyma TaxID=307937 RepID=A0A9P9E9Q4_9HYPO|nr:glutamyl-tRNA amidotransferase subunit A [Dactylonectria macrodidyma]
MAAIAKLLFSRKTPNIPSLLEISLDDIRIGLENESFTATDLVHAYTKGIQEIDYVFKSAIEVNPDAASITQQLDEEAKNPGRRGPLHRVPIMLKNNIVTLNRMEATAGSAALLGAKSAHEASIVPKLCEAGAVILGKITLTEWAHHRWSNAPTGWCPRGSQCTRPFYPNMNASGSSTGSGVATVLRLTFAALGTETGGSICNPAGKANVVGLKPTTGLVARDGLVPASNRLDAATILTAIAGRSEADNRTWDIPLDKIPDYSSAYQSSNLKGIQIDESEAFDKVIHELKNAGAEIVDKVELSAAKAWETYSSTDQLIVTISYFAPSLANYFKTLKSNPNNLHSLEDLIEYTKRAPAEAYLRYNVDTFELALRKDHYESDKYRKLEEFRADVVSRGGIDGSLDRRKFEVLVTPTAAGTPVSFASLGGSPLIAVPLGFYGPNTSVVKDKKGDVVSIAPGIRFPNCFCAGRFEEEKLVRVAHAFEAIHEMEAGNSTSYRRRI